MFAACHVDSIEGLFGTISSSVFRVVFLLCSVGVCLTGLYDGALGVLVIWRQKLRPINARI
jgi:hypothetical protein